MPLTPNGIAEQTAASACAGSVSCASAKLAMMLSVMRLRMTPGCTELHRTRMPLWDPMIASDRVSCSTSALLAP